MNMAKEQTSAPILTTKAGVAVEDNQNSITAGPRGPVLLQDYWLLEKLATFNRERIPERIVHAKGSAAGDLLQYDIPPEQVVGTAGGTKYGYDKEGKPFLTKEPKLLLNDNYAGKPEGIHLMIGRRPYAALGNSIGDQQMLEYTKAGDGERLAMLVLHDDAKREYAYGPAQGLPDTKVGTFIRSRQATRSRRCRSGGKRPSRSRSRSTRR